jgi:predicted glutamine amidotransferase
MCRMVAITNFVFHEHREILKNFLKLARSGKVLPGNTPGHLDGWGMGYYRDGEPVVRKSGHSITEEKEEFYGLCEEVRESDVLLLHLRKSSWAGTSEPAHAHPFAAGRILFAHNGTIYDYARLRDATRNDLLSPEALDSEVYFHYVLGFLPLGLREAFLRAVRDIRRDYAFSSLNCLFTDGKSLYAFREYTKHPWYYSLYHAAAGRSGIVASEPVAPKLRWKMLRKGQFHVEHGGSGIQTPP